MDSNSYHDDDRRLVSRCTSGDREASEILVRRFSNLVYRSVQYTFKTKHIPYTRDDLDDFHNSVFLELFENNRQKLRKYKGKNGCSLSTWIRIVTVRIVLNHLRKKGVDTMTGRKWNIPLEDIPELKESGADTWKQVERAEQEQLVRDGIKSLSPRDQLFLRLHFDQGLSVEEVSEIMKLSVQNAHTLKHRSIKRLTSYIASFEKF